MYNIQHSVFTQLALHICYKKALRLACYSLIPALLMAEGFELKDPYPNLNPNPKTENYPNLEADKPTKAEKTGLPSLVFINMATLKVMAS